MQYDGVEVGIGMHTSGELELGALLAGGQHIAGRGGQHIDENGRIIITDGQQQTDFRP